MLLAVSGSDNTGRGREALVEGPRRLMTGRHFDGMGERVDVNKRWSGLPNNRSDEVVCLVFLPSADDAWA